MIIFKTQYNDVKKAIKALEKGKVYEIDKADSNVLSSPLFFCKYIDRFGLGIIKDLDSYKDRYKLDTHEVYKYVIDKFGVEVLNEYPDKKTLINCVLDKYGLDILEKSQDKLKYRSNLFAAAVDKYGVDILEKFENWVWDDYKIVKAVFNKDKNLALKNASTEAMARVVSGENLLLRSHAKEIFDYFFGKDRLEKDYKYFWFGFKSKRGFHDTPDKSWFFKKEQSPSAFFRKEQNCIENAILTVMRHLTYSDSSIIYLSKIDMAFIVGGEGRMLGFPTKEFLKDNKLQVEGILNIPLDNIYNDDRVENMLRESNKNIEDCIKKYLSSYNNQTNTDDKYIKTIIIPAVDNLLQGNKIAVTNTWNGAFILQDILSSLPQDQAKYYSFCCGCGNIFSTFVLKDVQIAITNQEKLKEIENNNMVIIDSKKGLEDYIPQTDFAKQMLAKLSKDENTNLVAKKTKHEREQKGLDF